MAIYYFLVRESYSPLTGNDDKNSRNKKDGYQFLEYFFIYHSLTPIINFKVIRYLITCGLHKKNYVTHKDTEDLDLIDRFYVLGNSALKI